MLRADNEAASAAKKEGETRPQHVVESSGMCYVLIHAALARMVPTLLQKAVPNCIEFLLAGSAHEDHELRVLASQALHLCCSSHALSPMAAGDTRWAQQSPSRMLSKLLKAGDGQRALPEKE